MLYHIVKTRHKSLIENSGFASRKGTDRTRRDIALYCGSITAFITKIAEATPAAAEALAQIYFIPMSSTDICLFIG